MSPQMMRQTADAPIVLQFPRIYQESPADALGSQQVARTLATECSGLGAHRIHSPVRTPVSTKNDRFSGDVSPEVIAVAESVARDFSDLVIPESQRAEVSRSVSLRQFWASWMLPEQSRRLDSGKLSTDSISKYRQAINRWERITRPADWDQARSWPGIPVGYITGRYLTSFLDALGKNLATATVRSTWWHLRAILNYAVRLRAIDVAPAPEPVSPGNEKATIYRSFELDAVFQALAAAPDLQVAFVLACNAGMRPSDLFTLRWQNVDLGDAAIVHWKAEKTGKEQAVPLAPITVGHLLRLPGRGQPQALLFPGRVNPDAADPERSRPARRRNALVQQLLTDAGITSQFSKPWQAARATCNERLEAVQEGVGQFVLGHSLGLNAKSYRQPSAIIRDAILRVPQPLSFQL